MNHIVLRGRCREESMLTQFKRTMLTGDYFQHKFIDFKYIMDLILNRGMRQIRVSWTAGVFDLRTFAEANAFLLGGKIWYR